VFVQVGGGAFAGSLAAGWAAGGHPARLHAVQTEACAPLARAWNRSSELGGPSAAATHWEQCMWPWEHVGTSAADGILDDETYDWLPVLAAMGSTGGSPVVVGEAHVLEANDLARRSTGIDVSHTGSAGLAGVLARRDGLGDGERIAVVFSGIRR
jgi:threonine synthase